MVRQNKHVKSAAAAASPKKESEGLVSDAITAATAAVGAKKRASPDGKKGASKKEDTREILHTLGFDEEADVVVTAAAAEPKKRSSKTASSAKKSAQASTDEAVAVAAPEASAEATSSSSEPSAATLGLAGVEEADGDALVVLAAAAGGDNTALIMSSMTQRLNTFSATITQMVVQLINLKNDFKAIEKQMPKDFKLISKACSKKLSTMNGVNCNVGGGGAGGKKGGGKGKKVKRVAGVRAPSGFVKPTPISAELATFLGKELTVLMSRTEVSKEINKYIIANDLQDKTNGRRILADGPLSKLLSFDNAGEEELTYFNLQRYMKGHFMKMSPALLAPAAAAAPSDPASADAGVATYEDSTSAYLEVEAV